MAIITGTPASDLLTGTDDADIIRGLEGNDDILGNSGDDQLDGGAGNDVLAGNKGADSLFGGAGDDTLLGGQGNDLVIGEAGNDFIAGDAGTNTLTGGVGRDAFVIAPGGSATITDFFAGDDFIALGGDLNFDQIQVAQSFANTLIIDRRTDERLATLTNVTATSVTAANFVSATTGRPVDVPAAVVPLVDVTATDPIATTSNPDDPIVFTVSRTTNTGALTVNFSISSTNGVALQQPPSSVVIPAGQFTANVTLAPQNTSRDGTVTLNLLDAATYDVRTGTANGTVSAPIVPSTPAPAPDPVTPTFVDLVLTRVDSPATPSAGQRVTSTFTVTNRGTGAADRVVLDAALPVNSTFVSATPSQGSFSNFAGDNNRTGSVEAELGSIAAGRNATIVVVYEPQTTGNFLPANARVTSAQADVDPSNNFANANFTVIPSAPVLPTVSITAPTTAAVESNTTVQENQGATAQNFTITRSGGDLTQPLTVSYRISGTAQNTTDFEPIGSSVTFAPFETSRIVTILPIQDRQVEGTESVTLTLIPNALVYAVSSDDDAATISITDVPNPITPNPLPAVVSIVAIDNAAEEGGGSLPDAQSDSPRRGAFRISRDNTVGNLVVNLESTGNASTNDYTLSTSTTVNGVSALTTVNGINTLTIPDGAQFVDLIVTASSDNLQEGFEDLIVNVAPGVGYQIGRPQDLASDNPAFVRIRDNDTPPNVSITTVDGIGSETGDAITFRVSRNGDLSGARAVVVELPRGFTIGADPDGTGPLTAPITLDADTAARPRQIQRNGAFDPDGEDYTVTGTNVFLGLSTLSSDAGASAANLSQFPPDSTSNRFLVVIPAGQTFSDIVVTPINDLISENVERVTARIVPPPLPENVSGIISPSDIPPGGFIVTGGAAEAFILDSDAPSITIEGTDPIASELTFDTAVFTVRRTGSLAEAVTIPFTITATGATVATPGVDFLVTPPVNFGTNAPGFVTIPAGADSAQITVFPIDDLTGEGVEQFTITITPPLGLIVDNASVNGFVTDDAVNVSFFPGTPANDRAVGTAAGPGIPGNDLIIGGAGNDVLAGNTGDDTIDGGEGNDDIRGNTGAQNQGLSVGISDDDSLLGGAGDDTIDGEIGNDTIVGGPGNDVIFVTRFGTNEPQIDNNPISDTIVFNNPNEGIDRIISFLSNSFINRAPIDNNPDVEGNQNFPLGAEDSVVNDIIALVNNAATGDFDGLTVTGGPIVAAQFQSANGEANIPANPSARILYEATTGRLFYVPTGITLAGAIPADATQFAVLDGSPALAVNNFAVIGDANVPAPTSPTITLSTVTPTAVEGGTDGVVTLTRTGSTANSLTVFVGLTGTAQNGVDFTQVADGITIPAGSASVNITIDALLDNLLEGTENVTLTVLQNTGYTVGSASTSTVQVQDANALGTLTIAATTVNTTEGSNAPATVTITRSGSTASPLDVPITIAGTATNGQDFIQIPNTVTIPSGQASVVVNVNALLDNNIEGTESVSVALGAVAGFNTGSAPAVVTIQDANALGTLTIEATTVNTTEGSANPAVFTVTRTGSTANPLDVPITIGGTANNGTDIVQIPSTLTIPAGATQATINVTALNDLVSEDVETVTVTLGTVTAGVNSGVPGFNISTTPATAFVLDNGAPSLEVIAIDPVASELTFKTAVFEVRRTGDNTQALNVPYTLLPSGTTPAQPGQDFFALPADQVVIPAGQNSAFITIFPNDDITGEGFEEFTISLLPLSGFALRNGGSAIGFVTDDPIQVSFFLGTPSTDRIDGTDANDVLFGADNNDTISGNDGNDVLNGDAGADSVLGGDGNDLVNGGAGNDTLDGGAGNDSINGGEGVDVLTGGAGLDRFVFQSLADIASDPISGEDIPDNIQDFDFTGGDIIVLNRSGFTDDLNIGSTIAAIQFQGAVNPGAIVADANVRILYVGDIGPAGSVGRLYFTPNGTIAGSLPGDERTIAQFTDPLGAPLLNFNQVQVLP